MSNRALWATRTASPAKSRKRRVASSSAGAPRRSTGRIPVSDETTGGNGTRGFDERLEGRSRLERVHALRADLDDAAGRSREPGRLEVEDDEGRSREIEVGARRAGEPNGGAAPGEPASPVTTSSSSDRAIAVGADASAKRLLAASAAGTGPRRASTSSTSRSAASKLSCTCAIVIEHVFVFNTGRTPPEIDEGAPRGPFVNPRRRAARPS